MTRDQRSIEEAKARLDGQVLSSKAEDNPRKGNVDYSWKVEAGEK